MNIKLLIASFGLIILSLSVHAQNFSQEFQNDFTLDARAYAIESHSEGFTIGIGQINLDGSFRKTAKLISTDFDGVIQNTKVYEAVDEGYSVDCTQVINLPDGSQLVGGSYSVNNTPPYLPYVMHLNIDGSVDWAKSINTNSSQPPILNLLSDGSILVIFDYLNPGVHKVFCKMDIEGNFESFEDVPLLSGQIVSVTPYETSFEILMLSGDILNIENDLSNINWQRKYYNEIGIVNNRTVNGDYIYASAQVAFPGYMTVFRTDESGNLIWAKYIETWEGDIQSQITIFDIVLFNFIEEDENGNIIASANTEGGLNGSYSLILDGDGNYIDNHKIETFKNVTTLLDNDEYLIGGFLNTATYNTSNFIFEKRNLTSAFSCDIPLSHSFDNGTDMALVPDVVEFESIDFSTDDIEITFSMETIEQNDYCDFPLSIVGDIDQEVEISIYPNPSNGMVNIQLEQSTDASVKVYNTLGALVYSNENLIANGVIQLNQSPGLYLVVVETKEGIAQEKLILE